MLEFRKFLAVWLSIVILGTVLTTGTLRILYNESEKILQNNALNEGSNHFSVRWLGFVPDYGPYSDDYPDYYISINDLKDSILTMHIAMKIQNFENSSYWFLIGPYTSPPAGWTIASYQIGYIGVDETRTFTYSNVNRSRPESIPEGRLTESIQLVVKAYRDSSYTDFYSQDNFAVTYHFIDRTSLTWTILSYENGEDYPFHNWDAFGGSGLYPVSYEKYRSWPNSLKLAGGTPGKWFNATGSFTEAYLICPVYLGVVDYFTPRIQLNYTDYFVVDVQVDNSAWYVVTILFPVNTATHFRIGGGASENLSSLYIDDVYLIAK